MEASVPLPLESTQSVVNGKSTVEVSPVIVSGIAWLFVTATGNGELLVSTIWL